MAATNTRARQAGGTKLIGEAARLVALPIVAAALVPCGCGAQTPSGPSAAGAAPAANTTATAQSCTVVSAPLTAIDARSDTEPRLRIPQPPGWDRNGSLDSQLLRFTMVNKSLVADNIAPTAVVTLHSQRGHLDAGQVFDKERSLLVSEVGATNMSVNNATVCGLPARTVSYTATFGRQPPHSLKLICVADQIGDQTYAVTVTVQTTDPANPTYQQDSETILTGLQVLPPATTS